MTGSKALSCSWPALDRHRHGHVGADDGEGDLVDDLRDDRIDLAGHDARAGLTRRQVDLAETGLRAAGEQPQVVADLRELDGVALQRRGERHEGPGVARGFDEVDGGFEVEPADLPQVAEDGRRVVGVGGDARADRRRAHVDLEQQVGVLGETVVVLAEGRREAVELLPEGHRHRVLELGAADLQHVMEFDGLVEEGEPQQVQLFEEAAEGEREPDLDGRRVDVVRRLTAVGVIDGRRGTRSRPSRDRPSRGRCW